jgi:Ser/Thr protein kinase RdoA (MazF antagonist)
MMKLSTMKNFFKTVDEKWSSPVAEEILFSWDHNPGTCRIIRASSNFVCSFHNEGQKRILRFVAAEEREATVIQAEMDFLNHLYSRGLRVNRPVLSQTKRLIETVNTSAGVFHAVVLESLGGKQYETDEFTPAMITAWGRALGELHTASQGYPTTGRATWKDFLEQLDQELPASDGAARRVMDMLNNRLGTLPVREDNFGLIHYDFEADNLIWENDIPGIIDFDDCAAFWFVADIAYALRDLFDDRASQVDLSHPVFQDFIQGYRSVRQIEDEELTQISLLFLMLNLRMYAELEDIVAEGVEPDEPKWAAELRQKLASMRDKYRQELEIYREKSSYG